MGKGINKGRKFPLEVIVSGAARSFYIIKTEYIF